MNAPSIEFIIDGFDQGDHFQVLGRCGDEPIRLGDEFDAIYRLKKRRYPDEADDEPVRVEEHPVSLKVTCIHAYGRSLPVLGQCMTGSIAVEGPGIGRIAAGWILGRSAVAAGLPAAASGSTGIG